MCTRLSNGDRTKAEKMLEQNRTIGPNPALAGASPMGASDSKTSEKLRHPQDGRGSRQKQQANN